MDELGTGPQCDASALDRLKCYLTECIRKYGDEYQYSTDPRLLKIWILYADVTETFPKVYKQPEEKRMFLEHALLYESYALYLCAEGRIEEADRVYATGISRKAEPLDHLKKTHLMFLKYLENFVEEADVDAQPSKRLKNEPSMVDPWSASTMNSLLETINGDLRTFIGYHKSNKVYYGKVPLTSSLNVLRNKVIELGGRKYQIKGSTGTGAFAKVYKSIVDGNTEEMVALKIQSPPFPWEFYMYRQLDMRISEVERPSFGYAHEIHIFSDVSVLVCDYMPYGTASDNRRCKNMMRYNSNLLQGVINSHLVVGRYMDEVLCMYYTIEMLKILETLHSAGIIHGDFKPDNLLICYLRVETPNLQHNTCTVGSLVPFMFSKTLVLGRYLQPSRKLKNETSVVDPWSASTMNSLLKQLTGYHKSNKVYYGKVPLTSSLNVLRNKVIELGAGAGPEVEAAGTSTLKRLASGGGAGVRPSRRKRKRRRRQKKGLIGFIPLQFSQFGDIPLLSAYLQLCHYNLLLV